MGVAWDGGKIYHNGLLRGKQAMIIAAAGGPEEYYQVSGLHRASVSQILHPINHGTLAFCGMNVHEPFVAMDILGLDTAGRAKALTELHFRLEHLVDSPTWLISYS
jgi:putative NADPH-quinone reductase